MEWSECRIEILRVTDEFIKHGFKPVFSYTDKRHGRITPDNPPQLGVNYEYKLKDGTTFIAWRIVVGGSMTLTWQTSVLNKRGIFTVHHRCENIECIINRLNEINNELI